jgi:glycosyltransferase involved in cell wall biosynthesis
MVDMVQYSKKLGIDEAKLRFTGLLEGKSLVDEMKNADMLVIFSHYENFPVVINESLSLGVPVIATRVGGIPERVNKRNGILIKPNDESQLLYELGAYLNGKRKFNLRNIHKEFAKEFSADKIGLKLNEIYDKAINA